MYIHTCLRVLEHRRLRGVLTSMLQEERLFLPLLHVGDVETNGALAIRELVLQEQSVTGGSDLQTSHMSARISASCETYVHFRAVSRLRAGSH